ncbi:MAG: TPM domain-containing protein [Bacteroidia bacterium]|nr:TPM domain-containing protein [Bacteroidia bacterium]
MSALDRDKVKVFIEEAEKLTSGELRVHIESSSKIEPFLRGLEVFEQLNMHNTKLKNGVLFYIAYKSKSFAIVADKGINDLVPNGFWDEISSEMSALFKQGLITDGLVYGIRSAGEKLAKFFPYDGATDTNELSDEISFGE